MTKGSSSFSAASPSRRIGSVSSSGPSWDPVVQTNRASSLLAKKIDRIRWRLWHGRPQGALDLIDEILGEVGDAKSPNPADCSLHQKAHRRFAGARHICPRAIIPPHGVPPSLSRRRKPRAWSIGFCIVGRRPNNKCAGADVRHERNVRTRPHWSRLIDALPATPCRVTPQL